MNTKEFGTSLFHCIIIFIYLLSVLLYTTIITPFTIAFYDDDPEWSIIIDYLLYMFYFLDILLTFFSAYTDNEENVIRSKKVLVLDLILQKICINYLKGWFFLDLLSVVPIGPIVDAVGVNLHNATALKDLSNIARLSKILKMYRLIKLTK